LTSQAIAWLAALLSCDGHVSVRGKRRAYYIYSAEKEWLQKIRELLYLHLGIDSSLPYSSGDVYRIYLRNPRLITEILKRHGLQWMIERKAKDVLSAYQLFKIPRRALIKRQDDPIYFGEMLFDLSLYDYEKAILKALAEGYKLILIEKGRQIGISWTIALGALWYCVTNRRKIWLNLALYKEQAKRILRYIYNILYLKPPLAYQFIDMPHGKTKEHVRFRSESIFEISNCKRPDAHNVRSKTADVLSIDEAILLFDRMFGAIEPLTAATKGPQIWISTAGVEGCSFHRKVEKARRKWKKEDLKVKGSKIAKIYTNEDSILFYLPACKFNEKARTLKERFSEILCPSFTPKRLQNALEELKPINFKREYCCLWLGTENQMFPIIQKWGPQSGQYHVPNYHWGGLDVGEGRHPTVLIILEGDSEHCKTVKSYEWKREPDRKTLARKIKRACKPWKLGELKMDKTGIGVGLYERVMDEGLPVVGVSWNKITKNRMFFDLKDALGSGILRVGENEDQLLYELRSIFSEPIAGTNWFEFKSIDTDDYVAALAMAWSAVPKWKLPPFGKISVRERRILG